jgi:2',3'-cyclic-nucleotide 2'-phosphodiesterase (5'-nucleotidase family)
MNKRRLSLLLLALFLFITSIAPVPSVFGDGEKSATILFTHDMHSYLLPGTRRAEGTVTEFGGFARLKTVIDREKTKTPNALVLDAGDFSMGTLFQTIFSTEAPELRLMGAMGYDAVTLGNHEFDYRSQGLADMLKTAIDSKEKLPSIVTANLDRTMEAEGSVKALQTALDRYGAQDYLLLERDGVSIAVFGITGYDAIESAPMSEIGFLDPVKRAKAVVKEINDDHDPDLIICLSHSGTWEDPKVSEDQLLAKEVPDIDVIISGHTHSLTPTPLIQGDTIIASAGENAGFLGRLDLLQTSDGEWIVDEFALLPVDGTIREDRKTAARVAEFLEMIETEYLDGFGLSYNQVVVRSPFAFTEFKYFAKRQEEDPLGSLIADAYIHAVKEAEGDRYEPIAVAVVPAGVIRGSIAEGEITVSDLFNVSSLGMGRDGTPGYPLISVYLTGKELSAIAEVDASVTPIMESAQLYTSGLEYAFNPNRLIFNKVTYLRLVAEDGTRLVPENDKLYRVVCGLYSGQMLGAVKGKTFGMISLEPKDKNGDPIIDFEKHIIMKENQEAKEWLALVSYLSSFQKGGDGIPVIPALYQMPQGRKTVEDSIAFGDLISQPNHVYYLLVGAVSTILLLLVLLLYIVKRRREKRSAAGKR